MRKYATRLLIGKLSHEHQILGQKHRKTGCTQLLMNHMRSPGAAEDRPLCPYILPEPSPLVRYREEGLPRQSRQNPR